MLLAVAARLVDACCSAALHRHSSSNSSTAGYHDKAEERCALAYEVQLARYRTAWKLNQQVRSAAAAAVLGRQLKQQIHEQCSTWRHETVVGALGR